MAALLAQWQWQPVLQQAAAQLTQQRGVGGANGGGASMAEVRRGMQRSPAPAGRPDAAAAAASTRSRGCLCAEFAMPAVCTAGRTVVSEVALPPIRFLPLPG